jgi:hypothetical protein
MYFFNKSASNQTATYIIIPTAYLYQFTRDKGFKPPTIYPEHANNATRTNNGYKINVLTLQTRI